MLEYLVLGLLTNKPLTMYEMKKLMQRSTDHFFSASFGSLHPALNKLYEKQWVSFEEKLERGRGKKTYTITNAGHEAFLEWLQGNIISEKVREVSLLKLFFLGHLPEATRGATLRNYLAEMQQHIQRLEGILETASGFKVSEDKQIHKTHQLATLEFGIAYYQFVLDWYRKKFPELETARI